MRKTVKPDGKSGDTTPIPAFHAQETETINAIFMPRPKSRGNDTCARVNGLLQFSSVVLTVDIAGMGTCKVLTAIGRGDWLDLTLLNNKGEQFQCPVLWHTRFDLYFGQQ